jgi:hypothetical protein
VSGFPWLKLWNEFVEDDKFLAAADMVASSPAVAEATFLRLMAYANQATDRGSIAGFNPQRLASFLRVPVEEIRRLIAAFHELGMLIGERLANWAKRQTEKLPKPRSANAKRQARHRQKVSAATAQGMLDLSLAPVMPPPSALLLGVTSGADEDEDQEKKEGPKPHEVGMDPPEFSSPVRRSSPRESGTNPRAIATNPRARGTNPRSTPVGTPTGFQGEILYPISGGRPGGRYREDSRERQRREFKYALARAGMAGRMECSGEAAGVVG